VTTARAADTIERLYAAVRGGDMEEVVAYFAADCTFIDIAAGSTMHGHDEFRAYMAETWEAFPDFTPGDATFISEGDRVAADLVIRGTHRGTFAGIPATGRAVSWRAAGFYELDPDGLVKQETFIYDSASLLAQLQERSQ